MTRRDYLLISGAFAKAMQQAENLGEAAHAGVRLAAFAMCEGLKERNPMHFDGERFLKDAGVAP